MFNEDDLVRNLKPRAIIVGNIVVFSFLIILGQLWNLQINQGKEFFRYSMNNWLKKDVVKAPRGMIFDRNNELLVHNIPRIDAVLIPQYLKETDITLKKLAAILDMPFKSVKKILRYKSHQAKYHPVIVKKNISKREIAIIETENAKLPGVEVKTYISREYRDKEIGGNLLGYINEISKAQLPRYRKRDKINYKQGDDIGQNGIEAQFDLLLRGQDGFEYRQVDARGRVRRHLHTTKILKELKNTRAVPGNNIRLTIDRDLQLAAYEALEGKVGSAVAVDVNTGEVLAMVSRPSFDPTSSKRVSSKYWNSVIRNKFNPLRDRTIQEHYSPGSIFKVFTALAALEEGVVTANQKIQCDPTFKLGRRVYHDWRRGGHGVTDVYKSLRRSVDVYYYKIAAQMDIDDISKYATMFGLGEKTNIALPREIPGLIPTKEWKKNRYGEEWQAGETLSCAIGQSYVLVTPLQLAMAFAAIANKGHLYRPYVVKEVVSINGEIVKFFNSKLVRKVPIKADHLSAIREGLYQVVNHRRGTAFRHRGEGIRMSGKTGTVQVRSMSSKELFSKCKDMPYESRHHGLFAGYAPYENPRIAVAVAVEHGCSGSGAAAPVSKAIITKYMQKYLPNMYLRYAAEDKAKNRRYWAQIRKELDAKKRLQEQQALEEEGLKPVPEVIPVGQEKTVPGGVLSD